MWSGSSAVKKIVCLSAIILAAGGFAFLPSGCGGQTSHESISIEVGPVGSLKLEPLWIQIVNARGLAADNETLENLQLDFSPSGLLVHTYVQALTYDHKLLTAGYEAFGVPQLSTQKAVVGGSLDSLKGSLPASSTRVEHALAVLDGIGLTRIGSHVGGAAEAEYLSLRALPGRAAITMIPGQASAFVWEGSQVSLLANSDPRRVFDSRYLYLVVYPMVPDSASVPAATQGTPSAVGHEAAAPTYFVIRL